MTEKQLSMDDVLEEDTKMAHKDNRIMMDVDKDHFLRQLKDRGVSLEVFCEENETFRSYSTIRRQLKAGKMDQRIVGNLAELLEIDPVELVRPATDESVKSIHITTACLSRKDIPDQEWVEGLYDCLMDAVRDYMLDHSVSNAGIVFGSYSAE